MNQDIKSLIDLGPWLENATSHEGVHEVRMASDEARIILRAITVLSADGYVMKKPTDEMIAAGAQVLFELPGFFDSPAMALKIVEDILIKALAASPSPAANVDEVNHDKKR